MLRIVFAQYFIGKNTCSIDDYFTMNTIFLSRDFIGSFHTYNLTATFLMAVSLHVIYHTATQIINGLCKIYSKA